MGSQWTGGNEGHQTGYNLPYIPIYISPQSSSFFVSNPSKECVGISYLI